MGPVLVSFGAMAGLQGALHDHQALARAVLGGVRQAGLRAVVQVGGGDEQHDWARAVASEALGEGGVLVLRGADLCHAWLLPKCS